MSSSLYKNQSSKNFYNTQTVPKFTQAVQSTPPLPFTQLPNYNNWLGSEEGQKLLNVLKEENFCLKSQVTSSAQSKIQNLEQYLKNVAKVFLEFETENKQLRQQLLKREQDIQHALESFVLDQKLNEKDLLHQIHSYEEQLRIMGGHLHECQLKAEQATLKLDEKNAQVQRAKEFTEKQERDLATSVSREQELAHEVQLKQQKINAQASEIDELQAKLVPTEKQLAAAKTELALLQKRVKNQETALKDQESDARSKWDELNQRYYNLQTDQAHFKNLALHQEQHIKEQKEELEKIKAQQFPVQILQLTTEAQNLKKQLLLEQSRLKNASQREEGYIKEIEQLKTDLKKASIKYLGLAEENEALKQEQEREQSQQYLKQQKNLEKVKAAYIEQVEDQNLEISRLENRLKELNAALEVKSRELLSKEELIAQLKGQVFEFETVKSQLNQLRAQYQQTDHKLLVSNQHAVEFQEQWKKQVTDLEERFFNSQELYRKEQERCEQLLQQNEQLRWYQEQYDILSVQVQDFKINKDNIKSELQSYQSKINSLESLNEDLNTRLQLIEGELKQARMQLKQNEKKLTEVELLKEENRFLREQQHHRKFDNQSTDQEESDGKTKPVNIYQKTLSAQRSPQAPPKHVHITSPSTNQQTERQCQICGQVDLQNNTYRSPSSNPYLKRRLQK